MKRGIMGMNALVGLWIVLIASSNSFAATVSDNSARLDSLKALLKKQADEYPLDPGKPFTEAPGLRAMTEEIYGEIIKNVSKEGRRPVRYPLLLNNAWLQSVVARNKASLAKEKKSGRQSENKDETVSPDRLFDLQLFDDSAVTFVCDRIEKMLGKTVWTGHVKGDGESNIYMGFDAEKAVSMIKVHIWPRPIYYLTRMEGVNVYLLREHVPPTTEGPDCLVPYDNGNDVR